MNLTFNNFDTILLSAATILINSVYFKTSWIQEYSINHLQKTKDIEDILQEYRLAQHLHIY